MFALPVQGGGVFQVYRGVEFNDDSVNPTLGDDATKE
jgi:hypothetical protein